MKMSRNLYKAVAVCIKNLENRFSWISKNPVLRGRSCMTKRYCSKYVPWTFGPCRIKTKGDRHNCTGTEL